MKNRLIAAFFSFVTLSALAQQLSKAELFIHLKKVKGDIQAKLQKLEHDKMQLKAELDGDEYQKIEDAFEDLITLAEPYTASVETEIKDVYFDTIYHQMKSIHNVKIEWKQQWKKECIIRGWKSNYEDCDQHHENIKCTLTKHFKNDQFWHKDESEIFKIVDEKRTLSTILTKIEDDASDLVQKLGTIELLKQLTTKKDTLEKKITYKNAAEKVLTWWHKEDFLFPVQFYQAMYFSPENAKPLTGSYPKFNQNYFRPENWKVVEGSESFFGLYRETRGPIDWMVYYPPFDEEFEKHHQEYCKKNPAGRWKDLNLDLVYSSKKPFLFLLAHNIIYKKNNAIDDLKGINSLIAELACPS
jgi:hypothetical protein